MSGSRILAFARIGPTDHPTAVELTLLDEDGTVRTETIDDLVSVEPWGSGYIWRFKNREPVIVREDHTVHTLVAA